MAPRQHDKTGSPTTAGLHSKSPDKNPSPGLCRHQVVVVVCLKPGEPDADLEERQRKEDVWHAEGVVIGPAREQSKGTKRGHQVKGQGLGRYRAKEWESARYGACA